MPFKLPSIPGTKSGSPQPKNEASLDDILPTTASRVDLVLLVALCTDSMRDVLTGAFEKKAGQAKSQEDLLGVDMPKAATHQSTERSDLSWLLNLDLNSSRMQNLKQAGVDNFNGWRSTVLRRLGESLKVQPDAVRRAKAQHSRSGFDLLGFDEPNSTLPFAQVHVPNSLSHMDEKKRALILGAVLFIALSLENYSAYSRVLLQYLCECLQLPHDVLSSEEATTAVTLLQAAAKSGIDGDESRQKKAEENAVSRKWKVGLATVAGAAVIGITGGLAAPLILGVAGGIMGGIGLGGLATLLGATIANPVTIAALFGALGGRMTGRAMEKYSKDVEDFKFLPVHDPEYDLRKASVADDQNNAQPPSHKLRVAIGISGWVTKESDVVLPWRVFSEQTVEAFALRYEQAALIDLGTTLDKVIKNGAFSIAQSGAMKLALPAIAAAMAPIGLLKTGQIIDNPFTIAMERSDKAGVVLAHALMDRAQGERPVTLIGFSLGARVVFSCLEELASNNAFGLIEHAVLIGGPVPSAEMAWRRMRSVVAGRLVNVYANKDFLLGYLYRARNLTFGIAGLQAVTTVPGVENKDVSHIVTGHNQYRLAIGRILQEIRLADLDPEQVQVDNMELDAEKRYEREVHEQAKSEGKLKDVYDEEGQFVMRHEMDATPSPSARDTSSPPPNVHELAALSHEDDIQRNENQQRPKQAESVTTTETDAPTQYTPNTDDTASTVTDAPTQYTPRTVDEEHEHDDESDDNGSLRRGVQMMDMDPEPMPDSPVRGR